MEIVEKDVLTVVGIPVRARWDDLWVEMPGVWQQFFHRRSEIEHAAGERYIDVSLGKDGDEYLQLIGARVVEVGGMPEGMRRVEIPAQRYIHHKHRGPTIGIADSFGRMYEWARIEGIEVGELKLDIGYTARGDEREHDLFLALLPEARWRFV